MVIIGKFYGEKVKGILMGKYLDGFSPWHGRDKGRNFIHGSSEVMMGGVEPSLSTFSGMVHDDDNEFVVAFLTVCNFRLDNKKST